MIKVLIINFSGRKEGNCGSIARFIKEELSDEGDVSITNFSDISIMPCGLCNYECFVDRDRCPHIMDNALDLYNNIISSDRIFFIIPNYCNYPPANYFIFNERSQCCFQGSNELLDKYMKKEKKFIVISNTDKENFIEALKQQAEEPDILFLSARKYGRSSIAGDIIEEPDVRRIIGEFIWKNIG